MFEQAIAKLAGGGLALEIGMREHRVMGEGERDVEKERPVAPAVFRDVFDRAIGHHAVDLPASILVIYPQITWFFAFLGFTDIVYVLEGHAGLPCPVDDVGGLEAEPLIEALIGR
jgi:hypothetical protein